MDKKNTEISERLLQVIDYLGISKNKFAKELGYSRSQSIYDIINGNSKPSFDFLNKMYNSEYSEIINPIWLITGRGDMLIESLNSPEKKSEESDTSDPVMREMVLLLSKTVSDFQDRLNRIDKKFDEIDENFNSITETIAYQELNSITREIEEDKITAEMQKKIKEIEVKESTEETPVN